MTKKEELILKVSKEIVVKFIEAGRIYPSSFEENFLKINQVIRDSVKDDGREEE
ncbi:MAG: hypothetical protein JRD68_02055 [Deltaproteobacteria bacterium]|nr:hypothetical protein [Deltaproteobacteria bacterium]